MKKVIIATKNKGKAAEFKAFFATYNIEAMSLLDLADELPDIEETGTTFEENAGLKANQIAAILQKPVLADDSGIVIDALDGAPGIYSARYAGGNATDKENIKKVMENMQNIPMEKRTARFVCVLALAQPGKDTIYRTGYCEGKIALEEAGTNGFGYDPIFIPEQNTGTMAELTDTEKSKISHRSNAMAQLKAWIETI